MARRSWRSDGSGARASRRHRRRILEAEDRPGPARSRTSPRLEQQPGKSSRLRRRPVSSSRRRAVRPAPRRGCSGAPRHPRWPGRSRGKSAPEGGGQRLNTHDTSETGHVGAPSGRTRGAGRSAHIGKHLRVIVAPVSALISADIRRFGAQLGSSRPSASPIC